MRAGPRLTTDVADVATDVAWRFCGDSSLRNFHFDRFLGQTRRDATRWNPVDNLGGSGLPTCMDTTYIHSSYRRTKLATPPCILLGMPPSLAAVKAEIKTWERAFRAKHDRNPTREDIKARRDIGMHIPLIGSERDSSPFTHSGQV